MLLQPQPIPSARGPAAGHQARRRGDPASIGLPLRRVLQVSAGRRDRDAYPARSSSPLLQPLRPLKFDQHFSRSGCVLPRRKTSGRSATWCPHLDRRRLHRHRACDQSRRPPALLQRLAGSRRRRASPRQVARGSSKLCQNFAATPAGFGTPEASGGSAPTTAVSHSASAERSGRRIHRAFRITGMALLATTFSSRRVDHADVVAVNRPLLGETTYVIRRRFQFASAATPGRPPLAGPPRRCSANRFRELRLETHCGRPRRRRPPAAASAATARFALPAAAGSPAASHPWQATRSALERQRGDKETAGSRVPEGNRRAAITSADALLTAMRF